MCWWVAETCLSLTDEVVDLPDIEVFGNPIARVGGDVNSPVGTAVAVLHHDRVWGKALPAEMVAAALACEHLINTSTSHRLHD